MNAEENSLLHGFLEQLTAVRGVTKDPEADRLIRDAVQRQPDAAYLLVQRSILLEQALEQAKAEMAHLRQQSSQSMASSPRGFLDAHAWGKNARPAGTGGVASERSAAGTPIAMSSAKSASPYPAQRTGHSGFLRQAGGAGGSFLGTMAATAAGVAGGAFLFHGIGNLLDGGDKSGGDASSNDGEGAAPETPPQSLAEPDAGTEDLANAEDSGSLFDDPYGFDPGGGEDSLL